MRPFNERNYLKVISPHQSLPLMREVEKIGDFCRRERTGNAVRCIQSDCFACLSLSQPDG